MNVLYTYVLMHVQCIFFFISGIYAWSECTKKELDFDEQWKIKMNVVWVLSPGLASYFRFMFTLNAWRQTDSCCLFIVFPKLQIIIKLMPKKGLKARSPVFRFAKFSKRRCRRCFTWEESYWFQQYVNDIFTYGLVYPSKWTPRMITKNNISIIMRGNPTKTRTRCMVLLFPATAVCYTKKKTEKEEHYFEENVLESSYVINGHVNLVGFESSVSISIVHQITPTMICHHCSCSS